MKNMIELKDCFQNGGMTKSQYIDDMHKKHLNIFEYSNIIMDTDIKSISIEEDRIIMETKSENIKMICDQDDKRIIPIEIINFGEYEKREITLLKELITSDSVIFDIGANIGYYSLILSKYVPDGKVYAFEPILKTYNYLNENIELNKSENVISNNIALSNYSGIAEFYYYPEGSGNSSMKKLNEDISTKIIKCQVRKLDEFIENIDTKIDLIKCDTEGSEYLVFQGARESLIKHQPIVFTEMLRKWSSKFDYHPNEIIAFFDEIGYICFSIQEERTVECKEITNETVETNFIFLHKEKHLEYIKKFNL